MSVVGKSVPRADAVPKVTGNARYIGDLNFHGMLYAKIVRSVHPRAKVIKLDITQALALPGVECVVTAKDIPSENIVPVVFRDQPALAEKNVNYVGEPIAVVAAESLETAQTAAALVKVDYELLSPVLDVVTARNPEAPKIYGKDNIFAYHKIRVGDEQEGFNQADVIVENTYETPYQEHAYLEPQGMIAVPTTDGGMEVFGSMQCPFYVEDAVHIVLGLPLNKIRVVQTETGGAFGGKEDVPSLVAVQAVLAAWVSKKPVKLTYTRSEDIVSMSKRHPSRIRCKSGATKDGRLVAVKVEFIMDSGAYSTLSPVVLWRGTVHAAGPYRVPNVKVDAYAVATNKVPCGAYRGFGSPQTLFAAESQMDILAEKLNLDPIEFRRKNLLRVGDETATRQRLQHSVGAIKTLDKAVEKSAWIKKRSEFAKGNGHIRKGIGVSTIHYGAGLGAGGKHLARTGAHVLVMGDGSVQFAVGTTELGQGMRTVLSQIVAEELGVPYRAVCMVPTDTSRVPDSGPTVASRSTMMSGRALQNACAKIRNRLFNVAAEMLETKPENLSLNGENIVIYLTDKKSLSMSEVINEAFSRRVNLVAEGWDVSPPTGWDNETGQGDAYVVYAFAANIAEVSVNTLTGEIDVEKLYAAHDMGKAVNKAGVEGQIEGGSLQGMGYALMEDIIMQDGVIENPKFSTYIIPTSMDSPLIESIIVEEAYPDGPYGAKGFGEQPLMGIAPAIANAVAHAVGRRFYKIPIKPEDVLIALK